MSCSVVVMLVWDIFCVGWIVVFIWEIIEWVGMGFGLLDFVLGGFYWGDNVVWWFEGVMVVLFYCLIVLVGDVFDLWMFVLFGVSLGFYGVFGFEVFFGGELGDLLCEIWCLC